MEVKAVLRIAYSNKKLDLVVVKLKSIMSLKPTPLNMELMEFKGMERNGTVKVKPS